MTARDSHVDTVTRDAIETSNATPAEASAAQRQRVYRMRRKRAAIDAVLAAHRSSAKRILNVIVTRYGLEP